MPALITILALFAAAAAQKASIGTNEHGDVMLTAAAGRSVIANNIDIEASLKSVLKRISSLEADNAALHRQNAALQASAVTNFTALQASVSALQLALTNSSSMLSKSSLALLTSLNTTVTRHTQAISALQANITSLLQQLTNQNGTANVVQSINSTVLLANITALQASAANFAAFAGFTTWNVGQQASGQWNMTTLVVTVGDSLQVSWPNTSFDGVTLYAPDGVTVLFATKMSLGGQAAIPVQATGTLTLMSQNKTLNVTISALLIVQTTQQQLVATSANLTALVNAPCQYFELEVAPPTSSTTRVCYPLDLGVNWDGSWLAFPNVTAPLVSSLAGFFYMASNQAVQHFNLPELTTVGKYIAVQGNSLMATFSVLKLDFVGERFELV